MSAAIVRSHSHESLLSRSETVTKDNVTQFQSDRASLEQAKEHLVAAGFQVLDVGKFSISIVASSELYQQYFYTQLIQR